jgi:hypothetical protein
MTSFSSILLVIAAAIRTQIDLECQDIRLVDVPLIVVQGIQNLKALRPESSRQLQRPYPSVSVSEEGWWRVEY